MSERRVGLWMIGAFGGVATTVALGLAAMRRGLMEPFGLVTSLPLFQKLPLAHLTEFVIGGHDIRRTHYAQSVREMHQNANVFDPSFIDDCLADLEAWSDRVRPGTILNAGSTIARLADIPDAQQAETPREAIERIKEDLQQFQTANQLEQVVVINVASTEPPFEADETHSSLEKLLPALERRAAVLPASSLYAFAALDLALPYVNFTPSLGASLPALEELTTRRKTVVAGKDGKTGETLLKTVLAPMFAHRNLQILSWVGHNIFGNRDGLVLDDPHNKASKIRSKDQVISQIVGYKPQTHVSIEYIESLDDWKTAWDFIHFRGFLGVKMSMQFTWQGCDSLLAAPLVIDLARLALHSRQREEVGILKHLASFFKSPMGVEEHDFFKQFALLEEYVKRVDSSQ